MFNINFPFVITTIVILSPPALRAQCQPGADAAKTQSPASQNNSPKQPQFFDEPKFTVAGVTDTSNPAGHGSTVWRTSDALAKQTTSLSNSAESAISSASISENSLRDAAQSDNFKANYLLGKSLLEQGKPAEALPYLERASRLDPSDYENSYELALAYAKAGKYGDSKARIQELLGRQNKAELHHLLAEDEERLSDPLKAVHEFQRAAELDPSESNIFDWGAELLLHHAPEPAGEVFASGNRRYPPSSRMLIGLGVSLYTLGSYDRAAACLCQASDLNPQDSLPYTFLGKMLSDELPPSAETLARLKRFATLQPDNAMADYYYAVSLWREGRNSNVAATATSVESLLQKAVQLDPKLGPAFLQLGVLYSAQNQSAKAISAYQKAVDADPTLAPAHYRLAQTYREVGDRQKAAHELAIYKRLSKQQIEQAQRERHDLQQFVYNLRDASATAPPQCR
jgi:tetratricopeptide (TPR) repeat protein